jgi:ribosome assembly protein YihI (activator of Der GTPase)
MFEKEVIISGVRKQRDMLKELVEALEPKSQLGEDDLQYCEEILKRVESTLKRLRRVRQDSGKYADLGRMLRGF